MSKISGALLKEAKDTFLNSETNMLKQALSEYPFEEGVVLKAVNNNSAKEPVLYYAAKIKSGSLEAGNPTLECVGIDKKAYDAAKNQITVSYVRENHDTTIKFPNGLVVKGDQLEGSKLGHAIDGMKVGFGISDTYSGVAILKDTKGSNWKVSFEFGYKEDRDLTPSMNKFEMNRLTDPGSRENKGVGGKN